MEKSNIIQRLLEKNQITVQEAMILISGGDNGIKESGQINKQRAMFKEITIGEQIWMAENLNIDTFRNGDLIRDVRTDAVWTEAIEKRQPAWCYFEYNPENGNSRGKFYNWFAANDPRGLAPEGWKTPSDEDWGRLTEFSGGVTINSGWNKRFDQALRDVFGGFSGLPRGVRSFGFNPDISAWYSSTSFKSTIGTGGETEVVHHVWVHGLDDELNESYRYDFIAEMDTGFPVRCIRI